MKKFLLLLLVLVCITNAQAQNWLKDMYDPHVNFYTVQKEFNDWWAVNKQEILEDAAKGEKGEKEHGEMWKVYKRWEHDVAPMMIARHGNRMGAYNPDESAHYAAQRAQHNNLRSGTANWSYIGSQTSFDDNQNGAPGDSCTGRVNCVRFDPSNPSTIYCGAPSGGLWKSVNFGQSWQLLNTDNLGQIGVSDIAINPTNSNTIYIATGDIANSACFSVGVMKSTDGGNTWDTTGLSWTVSQGYLIARLLMSPLDSNTLIAATNAGVFKTTDGGTTWTSDTSIYNLTGMEFNPMNPNTIYTWGYQLYKSVDGAATWHHVTGGLPATAASGGFGVGLTPADTSCVYVLVSSTTTGQTAGYMNFTGIYQSLNGGTSFTLQSANPDPSNTGTQGLYDMVVGVSPIDRNKLVMAAVENAHSSDGGLTWTAPTFDSHVDHHDLRFYGSSGDTVFSADDGGLFISTDAGATWAGLNNGMHIGQIYNISSSTQAADLYLTGRQDEGTLLQDTTYENLLFGGDGLQCLIDPTNPLNMFGSSEYGFIVNSPDGGNTGGIIVGNYGSGVNGQGAWNTPFALDPLTSKTIYVAKDYIYKSIDNGGTWNTLNSPALDQSNFYTADYIMMAIAPTNNQYIYAGTYYNLYVSADGGATFTDISAGLDTPFFCMAVSQDHAQELWVGTTQGHIFKSVNAGQSWSDFSQGLPVGTPFSPQTIASVKGSPDGLYTGLYYAGGVYYRDSTMNQWMPYSNGLPNVTVNQIEIDYCLGKIRAATYGRDIWESDPYIPIATKPTAGAVDTIIHGRCTETVQFTDHSYYCPTTWQWYFPGGSPASSASPTPSVTYPDNDTDYAAIMIASNGLGADTAVYILRTGFCTGITILTNNNTIQIIPNPNSGSFTISLENDARGIVDYTVMDNTGRSIYDFSSEKDNDAMSQEFSLPGIASGVYLVRVTIGGMSSVQKLVVSN